MASPETAAIPIPAPRPDLATRERYARKMHRRQQLRRGAVALLVVAAVALAYFLAGPWIVHQRAALTLSAGGLLVESHSGEGFFLPRSTTVACRGNHWLDRTHDDQLNLLPSLMQLDSLFLNECHVGEPSLAALRQLTELEDLDLSRTNHYRYDYGLGPLDDRVLTHIQGLTRLRRLSLAGNTITDDGLKLLSGLTNLEDLDLEATDVTDDCLETLKRFPQLKSVLLDATRVTPKGFAKLRAALPGVDVVSEGSPELAASVKTKRGRMP